VPREEKPLRDAIRLEMPSPCFDRDSLADAVEEWLERDTVDAGVVVRVLDGRDTAFSIAVDGGPPLSRSFDSLPGDCDAQRNALALSIALAIDAVAPSSGPKRERQRFALNLDALLLSALPEEVAVGGGVSGQYALTPAVWPEIGVVVAVSRDNAIRPDLPVRFDTWLTAARLGACAGGEVATRVTASVCAGPWLGATTTQPREVLGAKTETHPWAALTGGADLRLRLSPAFGVHLAADTILTLQTTTVRVTGEDGEISRDLPRFFGGARLGACAFF
jgi:hypothetical protein